MSSAYRDRFKRWLDLAIAVPTVLVLSPLLILIALLIRLEDRGPALFRQERIGRDDQPFVILKFRSMSVDSEQLPSAQAVKLSVTRIGSLLRRSNLDELPQIINVLKGEMSLVGPRPPLPSQESIRRLRLDSGASRCLPGITGWAQVNSYHGMSDEAKVACDNWYHENISFRSDVKIIIKTFAYLMKKPPVY